MNIRQRSRAALFSTAAAGFILLAGCASLRPGLNPSNHYGVVMSSQRAHGNYMTLRFEGKRVCSGEVSRGTPVKCDPVAYPPRHVEVTWKTASGGTHIVPIDWFYQLSPRWFRPGDQITFTLTRFDRLSVVFVCRRPGNTCISYPPFTAYGKPIGYDLGYAVGNAP